MGLGFLSGVVIHEWCSGRGNFLAMSEGITFHGMLG